MSALIQGTKIQSLYSFHQFQDDIAYDRCQTENFVMHFEINEWQKKLYELSKHLYIPHKQMKNDMKIYEVKL